MQKMKAVMVSTASQIRPLLTPEQQKKLDDNEKFIKPGCAGTKGLTTQWSINSALRASKEKALIALLFASPLSGLQVLPLSRARSVKWRTLRSSATDKDSNVKADKNTDQATYYHLAATNALNFIQPFIVCVAIKEPGLPSARG